MILPQEVIRTKRDGETLTPAQIQAFVKGLTDSSFTDAQVGAMAMAIILKGMETKETVSLTEQMMLSGIKLDWPELDGPIVDKHSTGGVGDKVSFMLAAIVAANGAYVPMISGRGLGHTGGTVDKLESIAGFDVTPTIPRFKEIVKDVGMSIIAQTSDLAPADRRLYSIRDITATVDSVPLITASILSKKLAAGLDSLVMDVKVGNGALMPNAAAARELAQSIVNVANGAGVKTKAYITDMNQVLGTSAGNAVEIKETLDYLTGDNRDPRLHKVVSTLATSMLMDAGIAKDEASAETLIEKCLADGSAAEKFAKMIAAMGGPNDLFENPWKHMPKAAHSKDILAPADGYLGETLTRELGMTVVQMGGGRVSNGQEIDHSVGFDNILPLGAKVSKGDVLATVHGNSEDNVQVGEQGYLKNITITNNAPDLAPIIHEVITEQP